MQPLTPPEEAESGGQIIQGRSPFASLVRRTPLAAFAEFPDLRWLWLSSSASFMGLSMLHITRGWLVLRLADDSPFALALIAGAAAVPVIVVSMIGGALADKVSKKRLLVWGRSGNAAITFVVGTLDLTGVVALWHLFVTAVVDGSLMAINIPSRQALASEVVPEHKLLSAIGLLNAGMNVARILGPVAAGLLIVYLGTGWVFYIVCFWFGLSALSISAMEGGEKPPDPCRRPAIMSG